MIWRNAAMTLRGAGIGQSRRGSRHKNGEAAAVRSCTEIQRERAQAGSRRDSGRDWGLQGTADRQSDRRRKQCGYRAAEGKRWRGKDAVTRRTKQARRSAAGARMKKKKRGRVEDDEGSWDLPPWWIGRV